EVPGRKAARQSAQTADSDVPGYRHARDVAAHDANRGRRAGVHRVVRDDDGPAHAADRDARAVADHGVVHDGQVRRPPGLVRLQPDAAAEHDVVADDGVRRRLDPVVVRVPDYVGLDDVRRPVADRAVGQDAGVIRVVDDVVADDVARAPFLDLDAVALLDVGPVRVVDVIPLADAVP